MNTRTQYVLSWFSTFAMLVLLAMYLWCDIAHAEDGPYGVVNFGRSEYPLIAFDQVSMNNGETNEAAALGIGIGYRHGWIAGEFGLYDFGSMSIDGCFAAETGSGLDYSNRTCLSANGSARGIAATGLLYPFNGQFFLRYGIIRAQSHFTATFEPLCDSSGCHARGPAWPKSTLDNYALMGGGIELSKTVRLESFFAGIKPHGDSAFNKVRVIFLGVKF